MEDYDILEMHDIKSKTVMIVEDDEIMVNKIISFCEVLPLRFSYNLSYFSKKYIDSTKHLFSFYYNLNNSYNSEMLRLKKHFKHFMRTPFILYINKRNPNYELVLNICNDLKIECISNKHLFISKIKNDKKIFLIDSDDTLRNDDGTISKENKKAIKRIISNGDYAIVCTARPRYHTLDIMNNINSSKYIISSNGAEVYDVKKDKVIKSYFVDKNIIIYLIEKCFLLDLRLVLSSDSHDYVTKNVRNASQILLSKREYKKQLENIKIKTCMIIDFKKEKVLLLKQQMILKNGIAIINEKSKDDSYYEEWFCIGNSKANKGNGLINISNYLKVPLKNTFAIGNDYNDISMFKKCNISFAVGNANNDTKSTANYIVSSNNNSGVSEAINEVYDNLE